MQDTTNVLVMDKFLEEMCWIEQTKKKPNELKKNPIDAALELNKQDLMMNSRNWLYANHMIYADSAMSVLKQSGTLTT